MASALAPRTIPKEIEPIVRINTNNQTRMTIVLNSFLGMNISEICNHGLHRQNLNHCAHFVSHMMGYNFGYTCKMMSNGIGEGRGENVRVHEIFARCGQVGVWDDGTRPSGPCLAFVTALSNVQGNVMRNVPRKHIGIFSQGKIYHYSNTRNAVVSQTPRQFQRHYSGSTTTVFYGTFPIIA